MPSFDGTTPESKAVKNLIDAYLTFDLKNIVPLIAKDFKFLSFPAIPEHPDEGKEAHLERYAPLFSMFTKLEFTYHEAMEAPGKVILHFSTVIHTSDGHEIDQPDCLVIFTVVEEDGQLKVSEVKAFTDPEQRGKLFSWGANALAKAGLAA